jgi:YVTN family beta-propeller protein
MTDNNQEIPSNATIRQEYVKCGNPDCQNQHHPYLYAYWRQDKKLNKRYVGKNFEDFRRRNLAKQIKLKPSLLIKFKFIEQQASKGNVLAKQYIEKLKREQVSIDWAHRVLISSIRQSLIGTLTGFVDPTGVGYNSANGNIYVGNQGSNYVSIISGSTNKVIGTVTVGQGPVSPVFDPNNGNVYVTNFNSNQAPGNAVSVISTTLTPTQAIQKLINTIDSFHLPK